VSAFDIAGPTNHALPACQLTLSCPSVIQDYDCFYASVFEAENPALKSLPLAVQQKHIIVTCNYEARRRGLHKMQLIKEARKSVPDVIIVLGEDLTRFRDASKALYNFLATFTWNGRIEKLGFDEV
jgi:DNA polymerase iota